MRFIDETGNRYGRLLVLEEAENFRKGARWKCLCDCGKTTVTMGGALRSGRSQSCGCLQKERASQKNTLDLAGQKYGQLTAIRRVGTKHNYAVWLCECDCGRLKLATSNSLRSSKTKSCGCGSKKRWHPSNWVKGEENGLIEFFQETGRLF